eukprot:gene43663-53397_t
MAKVGFSRWQALACLLLACAGPTEAADPAQLPSAAAESHWMRTPRLYGRITAAGLGL